MNSRRQRSIRFWLEELEDRLSPAVVLSYSGNWAGYDVVAARGSISSISASWNVPSVTGPQNGYSATWVGIDGASSRTVEQIGTESDYVNGSSSYYAWYEMYPAPTFIIDQPIAAGDAITASVSFVQGQGFTLSIDTPSWSAPFTTTVKAPAARSSAEAVVEAPSEGNSVLPLANFNTETISNVSVTVDKSSSNIGTPKHGKVEEIDMESRDGAILASTSSLTSANTFTVTASHNQFGSGNGKGGSHDNSQTIVVVLISAPLANTVSLLANAPNTGLQNPVAVPTTTASTPSVTSLTIIDPFVGSGNTDALPAGHDNGAERGNAVPIGPVQVPPVPAPIAPAVPMTPQESRLDDGSVPPNVSYFAADAEAPILNDESTGSHDLADSAEHTVEAAGVVVLLGLGLGTSCGVSRGDRESRNKPIAL